MKVTKVQAILDGWRIQAQNEDTSIKNVTFELTIQSTESMSMEEKQELLHTTKNSIEKSRTHGDAIRDVVDSKTFIDCHCKLSYIVLGRY